MVDLPEKVSLHMILGALVQKLIFQNDPGGHFGFGPLAKNAGIFERDMEAKFFLKGSKKSNQSSNLTSQRMVTEVMFLTLLYRDRKAEGREQNLVEYQ